MSEFCNIHSIKGIRRKTTTPEIRCKIEAMAVDGNLRVVRSRLTDASVSRVLLRMIINSQVAIENFVRYCIRKQSSIPTIPDGYLHFL